MNDIAGVLDGSCTQCGGSNPGNCTSASCDTGYHSFVDGVGCSGVIALRFCSTWIFLVQMPCVHTNKMPQHVRTSLLIQNAPLLLTPKLMQSTRARRRRIREPLVDVQQAFGRTTPEVQMYASVGLCFLC